MQTKENKNIIWTCRIIDTGEAKHSDMIDTLMYAMYAKKEAETLTYYYQLHIKQKPIRMPDFLRKWLLSKVVHLGMFRKK